MTSAEIHVVSIRAPGGPEVLKIERAEMPSPGPGDVLIEVKAAGVNRPDISQRLESIPCHATPARYRTSKWPGSCRASAGTFQILKLDNAFSH